MRGSALNEVLCCPSASRFNMLSVQSGSPLIFLINQNCCLQDVFFVSFVFNIIQYKPFKMVVQILSVYRLHFPHCDV